MYLSEAQTTQHRQLSQDDEKRRSYVLMMSHDLKTPLNAVQGFLDLLDMGAHGELSETARRGLKSSARSLSRVIDLVEELLAFEKQQAGLLELHIDSTPVMRLFEDAFDSVAVLASEKKITLDFRPTDLIVEADHAKIVRVLVNLLGNAIKFSRCGTTIAIEASSTDRDVSISVEDQGRGISREKLEKIFEPFVQACQADSKEGSGLGLTLSKSIIEAHGGALRAESIEGVGSRFVFSIPSAGK